MGIIQPKNLFIPLVAKKYLDELSVTPVAAYSTQLRRTAYAGAPMEVEGNATANVFFPNNDGAFNLGTSNLTATQTLGDFISTNGHTSLGCRRFFNQSANWVSEAAGTDGIDFIETDKSRQPPVWTSAGGFEINTGNQALAYNDVHRLLSASSFGTPNSFSLVFKGWFVENSNRTIVQTSQYLRQLLLGSANFLEVRRTSIFNRFERISREGDLKARVLILSSSDVLGSSRAFYDGAELSRNDSEPDIPLGGGDISLGGRLSASGTGLLAPSQITDFLIFSPQLNTAEIDEIFAALR